MGGSNTVNNGWCCCDPRDAVRGPQTDAGLPRLVVRRLLWLTLRRVKERGWLTADSAVLNWMRREAEHDYFAPYRPATSRVPILHFVMAEGRELLRQTSAQSWRRITSIEPLVVGLPGSHHSLFRETNLAPITQAIEECCPPSCARVETGKQVGLRNRGLTNQHSAAKGRDFQARVNSGVSVHC